MLVTPACYAHITQKLMSISCGKVVAMLEVSKKCLTHFDKTKLL